MNKVFLGPLDLGLNQVFKEALEKEGYKVTTCSFVEHGNYGWKNDIELKINKTNLLFAIGRVFGNFFKSLNYDIYHFKFGQSLLPWNLDLPILKLLGKKIIMNWHGQDIRQWDRFKNDPYNKILAEKMSGGWFKEWKKHCRYHCVKFFTDFQAVSTPDLLEFAPVAKYMPEMAPAERISAEISNSKFLISKTQGIVTILHAPSHRGIKGTEYIIKAVENLKKEGEKIELLLAENVPADKMGEYYQKADLVIDQLLIGTYGVVSVEGMLAYKPVICYIREDLKKVYPESLPVISANPDNIKETIKDTLKKDLQILGEKSFEYVSKTHLPEVMAREWAKVYREF